MNWYETTIDISNAFRNDWKFPNVEGIINRTKVWEFNTESIFNIEWLRKIEELGLKIIQTLVFYKPANYISTTAHIDAKSDDAPIFGFNIIIGGNDSVMVWYDTPITNYKKLFTDTNLSYTPIPIDVLTEIDRLTLNTSLITMVRVNIPHAIIMGNDPRWCISLRTDYEFETWEDAVNYMKSNNLLIER